MTRGVVSSGLDRHFPRSLPDSEWRSAEFFEHPN